MKPDNRKLMRWQRKSTEAGGMKTGANSWAGYQSAVTASELFTIIDKSEEKKK
jgi:hypothetical protein